MIKKILLFLFLINLCAICFARQDVSELLSITQKEAKAYFDYFEKDDEKKTIQDFNLLEKEEYLIVSFKINEKLFKIISESSKKSYLEKLRQTFKKEFGLMFEKGDIYLHSFYKNRFVVKGDLKVGDILTLNSLSGKKGLYIVDSMLNETDDEYVYIIKPFRSESIFINANFEKHKRDNILYFTSAFDVYTSDVFLDADLLFIRNYPLFLKAGTRLSIGSNTSFGVTGGMQVYLPFDSIFNFKSNLLFSSDYHIFMFFDFNKSDIVYGSDLSLSLSYAFSHKLIGSFGIRFSVSHCGKEKEVKSLPVLGISYIL